MMNFVTALLVLSLINTLMAENSFFDLEHTYLSCRILYLASALNILQYSD